MKKGQGLPLNVIIIAIIVLIVMVVLVTIFSGNILKFQKGVNKQAQVELTTLQLTYGSCKPLASIEKQFTDDLSAAQEAEDVDREDEVRTTFKGVIARCKASPVDACDSGCVAR